MSYGNAFLQRDLLEMKAVRQYTGLAAWDVTHPTGSLFLWHVKLSGAPGTMLAGAVYDVYVRWHHSPSATVLGPNPSRLCLSTRL